MALILVVDDERSMREFLEILLAKKGHKVHVAEDGKEGLERLAETEYDLVITDLKMPEVGGLDVLARAKERWPQTEVIMMTAYSTTETAVEAMKAGAYDYIAKPFKINEAGIIIDKALEKRELVLANHRLRKEVRRHFSFDNIIGNSRRMNEVFSTIKQIADTRSNILVSGESGTGKELVARAVHYNSSRADKPLVVINCGAIPDQLMESELFGHVKGSFTGAIADKKGLFEVASGGSVFLDEIGELSLHLQVKLLRAIQERKVKRVGGLREIDVDTRLIAATNKELEVEVANGRFREDLYFRINVIQIGLPALRERMDDVPLLAHHFLEKYNDELGKVIQGFAAETMAHMEQYGYPGNVRELENIVERAVAFELSEWVTPGSLPARLLGEPDTLTVELTMPDGVDFSLDRYTEQIERKFIVDAMTACGGSVTDAASRLGLSFRSMRYKMSKYGIRKESFS